MLKETKIVDKNNQKVIRYTLVDFDNTVNLSNEPETGHETNCAGQ